jgi:hypothetical protein
VDKGVDEKCLMDPGRPSIFKAIQNVGAEVIVGLNADLSKNWSRVFDSPSDDYAGKVLSTSDGGVLVLGRTTNTSPNGLKGGLIAIKFDSGGNLLWAKGYGSCGENLFYDKTGSISEVSDGYIIGGQTNNTPGPTGDIWIIKIDKTTGSLKGGSGNCAIDYDLENSYILNPSVTVQSLSSSTWSITSVSISVTAPLVNTEDITPEVSNVCTN